MNPIRHLVICGFSVALLGASTVARADDATARALFNRAKVLFEKRGDTLQNSIDAVSTLESAESQVQSADLKYDILVLEARSLYWQGRHTQGDENKKVIYLKGRVKADAAVAIDDSYAEAHYFAGINMGAWARARGVIEYYSIKNELIDYMLKAAGTLRTTRDGSDGSSVDGYGPDRVLGRLYHRLPGVLGGDYNLAVTYLRTAVAKAPRHALNTLYLADCLYVGNEAHKAEGKRIASELVSHDPRAYGAALDRIPETVDEFQLARDLLNGHPVPGP